MANMHYSLAGFETLDSIADEIRELQSQLRPLQERLEALRDELKGTMHALQIREHTSEAGTRSTLSEVERTTLDSKLLRTLHPEIAQACTRSTVVVTLKVS